jgi:hypothetical protein
MVGGPERLVFEGAPVIEPPLAQDHESRNPVVCDGEFLDTVAACPPLTIVEGARLKDLRAKEVHRLGPESAKAREIFVRDQARRTSLVPEVIARLCSGILLSDLVLPFDDPELAARRWQMCCATPLATRAQRWPIRWRASIMGPAKRR